MDFVLEICDRFLLDKVWATLVPASAFAHPSTSDLFYSSLNSSSTVKPVLSLSSSWEEILAWSQLPHPQLPLSFSDLSQVAAWPRDYLPRQIISLLVLTLIGIFLLYFLFAGFSYYFVFNHEMMKHPRFLKNQVRLEITTSMKSFPGMTLLTLPCFLAEVRGHTLLYDDVNDYGWGYFFFSIFWFLLFTDYCIYWIHRWLHLPMIYKHIHKPHHKWLIPTPFASHAFHPVDGFAQSIPYHLFIHFFPLQRHLYLALFVAVNCWAISIHDSDMITGHPLEKIINGPAHHTLHHLYFTVNYGQYFTWADRVGGSYRHPAKELDPLLEVKAAEARRAEKAGEGKEE